MPLSHTWMRNINWTHMKEKYLCPVYPVIRGLYFMIFFLILGICFLSARAETGEISDHSDSLPYPTNANCNVNDWIQTLILIVVALIFIISVINLSINYKRHTWMRNINWKHMKEKYLCPVHPVIRGLYFMIFFLILGICFLSDWIQILILLIVVNMIFIIAAINLYISYKHEYCGNHRKQHDPEAGKLQRSIQTLQDENEWRKARNKTENITLDAGTAHPNLSISGDQKSFKHEAQPQKVPPNPGRFDSTVCVLGSEGFSSDKHYWEVDVTSITDWDLGVAKKSIRRKGKLFLSPKEGFWALGLNGRDYWAKTDPWTRVMVQKKPKKIGVYLSYPEGRVTFFNVTDMSVLFTFNDCSFSGEVYPFFKNSHKETIMRISSIKEED